MGIDPADATSVKVALPDQLHDFRVSDERSLKHQRIACQQSPTAAAVSNEKLAEHELVAENLATGQQAVEVSRIR